MEDYIESYRFWKSPLQIIEYLLGIFLLGTLFFYLGSGLNISKTLNDLSLLLGVTGGFFLFLSIPKLKVRVTDEYVGIRFFPFHLSERKFSYDDFSSVVVEQPLLGFGASALLNPKTKYFRLRGQSESVILTREEQRYILIGSPDPENLAAEIRQHMNNYGSDNVAKANNSIFNGI